MFFEDGHDIYVSAVVYKVFVVPYSATEVPILFKIQVEMASTLVLVLPKSPGTLEWRRKVFKFDYYYDTRVVDCSIKVNTFCSELTYEESERLTPCTCTRKSALIKAI